MNQSTLAFWGTLLARLAPRLNAKLPDGVQVEVDQRTLTIRVEGEIAQRVDLRGLEGSDPEATLETLLSGLQDLVIRCTGRIWPTDAACPEGGTTAELPLPQVLVDESTVRAWFSRDDEVVCEVALIRLEDVSQAP